MPFASTTVSVRQGKRTSRKCSDSRRRGGYCRLPSDTALFMKLDPRISCLETWSEATPSRQSVIHCAPSFCHCILTLTSYHLESRVRPSPALFSAKSPPALQQTPSAVSVYLSNFISLNRHVRLIRNGSTSEQANSHRTGHFQGLINKASSLSGFLGLNTEVSALIHELYCLIDTQPKRHDHSDHSKDTIYFRAMTNITFELRRLAPRYIGSEEAFLNSASAPKKRLDARLAALEEQDKRDTFLEAMARLNQALQVYTKEMNDLGSQIQMTGSSQYAQEKQITLGKEWEEELAEFEKVRKASS